MNKPDAPTKTAVAVVSSRHLLPASGLSHRPAAAEGPAGSQRPPAATSRPAAASSQPRSASLPPPPLPLLRTGRAPRGGPGPWAGERRAANCGAPGSGSGGTARARRGGWRQRAGYRGRRSPRPPPAAGEGPGPSPPRVPPARHGGRYSPPPTCWRWTTRRTTWRCSARYGSALRGSGRCPTRRHFGPPGEPGRRGRTGRPRPGRWQRSQPLAGPCPGSRAPRARTLPRRCGCRPLPEQKPPGAPGSPERCPRQPRAPRPAQQSPGRLLLGHEKRVLLLQRNCASQNCAYLKFAK